MGITLETVGAASLVTLDMPEVLNALGPDDALTLIELVHQADAEANTSAIVITGNGAFCSGGNLRLIVELARSSKEEVGKYIYSTFQELIRLLVRVRKPTIAAVDGPAIGAGFDLALVCDVRLVSDNGWFRQGWARVGLIPGTGQEFLLRRLAPSLLWDLLGGRKLLPVEAHARGIATHVSGSAREQALEMAEQLSRVPQNTLAAYCALHRHELQDGLSQHLAEALELQLDLLVSEEFQTRARQALNMPA